MLTIPCSKVSMCWCLFRHHSLFSLRLEDSSDWTVPIYSFTSYFYNTSVTNVATSDILPVLYPWRFCSMLEGLGGQSNCLLVSSLIYFTRFSCSLSASPVAVISFLWRYGQIWPTCSSLGRSTALIGVVLFVMIYPCPPSTLKCNIWEGTLVSILTSMAHCGSSVTNVTHPSTSNVPQRNQKIVSGLNVLFVHFFVADNSKFQLLGFIYPPVHCILIFHYVLCSFSLKKMGRNKNKICPDSDSKESSTGGSAHKGINV